MLIVVNPLVPYVNDVQKVIPTMCGAACGASRHGLPAGRLPDVQADRPPAAARDEARSGSERYPGVDIILIEPEPSDELMFGTSVMDFTRRVEIARHGFDR